MERFISRYYFHRKNIALLRGHSELVQVSQMIGRREEVVLLLDIFSILMPQLSLDGLWRSVSLVTTQSVYIKVT